MKHGLEEPHEGSEEGNSSKRAHLADPISPQEPQSSAEGSAPPDVESAPTGKKVAEPPLPTTEKAGPQKGAKREKRRREKKEPSTGYHHRAGTRRNDEAKSSTAAEGISEDPSLNDSESKVPRFPKRQCALLIGFCGSGYSGMQIQPTARTIEGTLFQALVKAGAVSQDNADNPVKVNLGRAARTDAGVHAAGNVVSLKMITSPPDVPDLIARINEEMPPEIRLWGYVRVQNSFSARTVCDSRKYTYFFPTYLLIPPKPDCGLDRALKQHITSYSDSPRHLDHVLPLSASFWEGNPSSTYEEDLVRKRWWRVSPEQVEQFREAARAFEGTHNFHNFTVGREFNDRSNQRHMKKIEVADPVVYGDTEWISVLFHGQSFMLHQRKMMSSLVLSCRTGTPKQIIDELYGARVVFIPKMPSLGLLLEHPIFDSYNARMAVINEKLDPSDPNYRPPIDFDIHQEAIAEFKQKYIYDNMRLVEDRDALFDAWIRMVDAYAGKDLLYLNPKGIIPSSAVIKKGERRENPFKERKIFDATSFTSGGDTKTILENNDEEDEGDEVPTVVDKAALLDMEG